MGVEVAVLVGFRLERLSGLLWRLFWSLRSGSEFGSTCARRGSRAIRQLRWRLEVLAATKMRATLLRELTADPQPAPRELTAHPPARELTAPLPPELTVHLLLELTAPLLHQPHMESLPLQATISTPPRQPQPPLLQGTVTTRRLLPPLLRPTELPPPHQEAMESLRRETMISTADRAAIGSE